MAVAPSLSANKVAYRLPYDGQERTYRVTLAVAPKRDSDGLVSTFLSGAVRTVNAENRGLFSETWNGLDDNYMPVPLGEYVAKGIYMPAEKWKVDGQFHSITPQFVASPGDSWTPSREQDHRFPVVHGHVFEPIYDIDVGEGGKAVFLSGYAENWFNPFIVDLNRPVGIDQVISRFASNGRAGGQLVAHDGTDVWMVRFNEVYCPTNRGFGLQKTRHGHMVTVLDKARQFPSDMTVGRANDHPYLYLCEPHAQRISVLDGKTGKILKRVGDVDAVATMIDRTGKTNRLFALHKHKNHWRVSATALADGIPVGGWKPVFDLAAAVKNPRDLEMDRKGNFYCVAGRFVGKLSPSGKSLFVIGKSKKLAGSYDPRVLLGPNKLAYWTDTAGNGRLIVTATGGPSRISEWSCSDGKLLRQWFLCQNAAAGFCMDPLQPEYVYSTALIGSQLIRYKVDYGTGGWSVDAVWEDMCYNNVDHQFPVGRMYPQILHREGNKYLCFAGGGYRCRNKWMIYRHDRPNDKWIAAAAWHKDRYWHDASGDGKIQEDEYDGPHNGGVGGNYWGAKFFDDLSLVEINNNWWYVQRMSPPQIDRLGNPVYKSGSWSAVLTDPYLDARRQRKGQTLNPLRGGNEIGNKYWNWSDITGSMEKGIYVAGVHKPDGLPGFKYDEAGNVCSEWKLTFWEPKEGGEFRIKWRVGRKAFGAAEPGQVYATMHISPPVYGLIGMQDGNGIYHLFTTDGLFVDTLMYDRFRFGNIERGGMYSHSGGSYYGRHYLNRDNGKVYIFMGRASNNIYEIPNWRTGFVKPLALTTATINLTAEHIALPPATALRFRPNWKPSPALADKIAKEKAEKEKPAEVVAAIAGQPFDPKQSIKLTELAVAGARVGFYRLGVNNYSGDQRNKTLQFGGKECKEFLFAHAPSTIIYKIPAGYTTFTAIGTTFNQNGIKFIVKADGKVVYTSKPLEKYGKALPIQAKIPSRTKTLELIVDDLGSPRADHSAWAFPRLSR